MKGFFWKSLLLLMVAVGPVLLSGCDGGCTDDGFCPLSQGLPHAQWDPTGDTNITRLVADSGLENYSPWGRRWQ